MTINLITYNTPITDIKPIETIGKQRPISTINMQRAKFDASATVHLSKAGKIKYYKDLFDKSDLSSVEDYAKKYVELKEDIEKSGKEVNENIELLDKAFEEVITQSANESADKIKRFTETYGDSKDGKVSIDSSDYVETYLKIANQLISNVDSNSEEEIDHLINKSLKGNKDFSSYKSFKLVTEIADISYKIQNTMYSMSSKIAQTDEKNIIHNGPEYDQLIDELNVFLNKTTDFNSFFEEIETSNLSVSFNEMLEQGMDDLNESKKTMDVEVYSYLQNLKNYKDVDDKMQDIISRKDELTSEFEESNSDPTFEENLKFLEKTNKLQIKLNSKIQEKEGYQIKIAHNKFALKKYLNKSGDYLSSVS